jgi:DNA-binding MltR family transcriptional regulator
MENKIISENKVKEIILQVLTEDTSKVRREEYAKVQFKIDELQNSLNETLKEFRKLDDSIPNGLKTISNGRILGISQNLGNAQKLLVQLKDKVKQHKKSTYTQQVDEKKGKN